jgi:putative ABC transport system ATP-binding protein
VEFALDKLEVERGEKIALTGPSGCGKSTLLNIVAGMIRAEEGTVSVLGKDLRKLGTAALDAFRGHHCGFVFQSFHLLHAFTAQENVEIGLRFGARVSAKERKERAIALLKRVGLEHRLNARTSRLSVGERQRVAIARAIAGKPEILLADEPTGSLDPRTAAEVFDLLLEVVAEAGCTMLMVTHDLALAAKLPRQMACQGLVTTVSSERSSS